MHFYFVKIVFVRLIIRGRIIYKTLTFFVYFLSIICPHVIEPINFFYGEYYMVWYYIMVIYNGIILALIRLVF